MGSGALLPTLRIKGDTCASLGPLDTLDKKFEN